MMQTFDKSWTLFLDRDGVINKRPPVDYVKKTEEFHFLQGTTEAIKKLSGIFNKIIVVTNQQGIGKGLYSIEDLKKIHTNMLEEVTKAGGRIDSIYFCPDLAIHNPPGRKPNTGMALEAQTAHPEINFKKSVMVGDTVTDMEFGKKLGMWLVFVSDNPGELPPSLKVDCVVPSLSNWAESISGDNKQL